MLTLSGLSVLLKGKKTLFIKLLFKCHHKEKKHLYTKMVAIPSPGCDMGTWELSEPSGASGQVCAVWFVQQQKGAGAAGGK